MHGVWTITLIPQQKGGVRSVRIDESNLNSDGAGRHRNLFYTVTEASLTARLALTCTTTRWGIERKLTVTNRLTTPSSTDRRIPMVLKWLKSR